MLIPHHAVVLGQAQHADAYTVARQAAVAALQQLPVGTSPGWALVICGGQHAPEELLRGFRAALGSIPLVGGCAAGLITATGVSMSGHACGLLLFSADLAPLTLRVVDGLDQDEAAAGRQLGAMLAGLPDPGPVLLFYDSVKSSEPLDVHICSRLLDGLYTGLDDTSAPVLLGAGMLDDLRFSSSYIFDGQNVRRHAALAVVLPSQLHAHIAITHGCYPVSDFLEITAIDGARVLELDGQPALALVAARLGTSREALAARQPLLSLTLGEKHGDPFAPFNDRQYVNRLVMAADLRSDALILFEADFQRGSRVQLMLYDPARMFESARQQTTALLAALGKREPLFGLYIDCAGRSTAFSGLHDDETAPIRQQVATRCPLLGFYSGVEIAPILDRARPLDWTGVLALFTVHA
ncbi:MAG TPA: FIST N-terminal domain-containing protein [Candidatus Competibacteraceae bacterium]|nr:MAG: hypothetical protein EKK69_03300 [Candidatus Competibacteraceae bacterium]HQC73657.1 FIST N-terminal domain-containing protein [Candidatus Competibacteraceae bacterium]